MDDQTVFKESAVAQKLGVGREILKELRQKLFYRDDFFKVQRELVYTKTGLQKILGFIGKHWPQEALEEAEDSSAPYLEKLSAPSQFTVTRKPLNRKIIFAESGSGESIRIRVKDSKNFMPGMQVPARLIEGDFYELATRCPRYKGRW